MMFLSCLFTYPIYSPPLNEILEETVRNKKSVGIFVSDSTRLIYRILQTIGISIVAYFCPFFGDIISLDILSFTWLKSLMQLGGFVFTAISMVIPPLLHFICFKNSLSTKNKCIHILTVVFSSVFMLVSTAFSTARLIHNIVQ